MKMEKFNEACADLKGHVFDICNNKIKNVDNYNSTLEKITTYLGTDYNAIVQESIKSRKVLMITEPTAVVDGKGVMIKAEEVKFSQKYSQYLSQEAAINKDMKKAYNIVWGQTSKEMKA